MTDHRVAAADEPTVREIVERFRLFYEGLINEYAEAGKPTRHIDFLMAVHNFHKFAVLDVMEREPTIISGSRAHRVAFLKMWKDTWDNAIHRIIEKELAK